MNPVNQEWNILTYFDYRHLPPELAEISKLFADVAHEVYHRLPNNPATHEALKGLLVAKDWAVRARLPVGRSHISNE